MRFFSTDPHEPGVIAVGQQAVGIFALGQFALGVIAVGQVSRGVIAVGQLAVGVVAVGQGAFGLWRSVGMAAVGGWHVVAMLGLGGRRGVGMLWVPLLPTSVEVPPPDLPPETPAREILAARGEGWVRTTLRGEGSAVVLDGEAAIDAAPVLATLERALGAGEREAMVRVHAAVDEEAGYREVVDRRLVADEVITWSKRRPRYFVYGKSKKRATRGGIVLRAVVQATLVAIWLGLVAATVLSLR